MNKDFSQLGRIPVSQQHPTGEDIRYDADFEALQQEIDKLSIAAGDSQGCQWDKVVDLSAGLLEHRSKHILVAAYLCAGLTQTQGIDGLIAGTIVLSDMVANFWDNLYPPKKRLRGRLNAIDWWQERVGHALNNYAGSPLQATQVELFNQALNTLDENLEQKVGNDAPILRPLLNRFASLPVEAAPAETAPAEKAENVEEPIAQTSSQNKNDAPAPEPPASLATVEAKEVTPVAAANLPQATTTPEDTSAANAEIKTILQALSPFADWLMQQDITTPLSYRLSRLAIWTLPETTPPSENYQTLLPPPDNDIAERLNQLWDNEQYAQVINLAENHIAEYIYWLDLSCFTAQALEKIEDGTAASQAISEQVLLLLQHLPHLETLQFNDSTPFANNRTQQWLRSLQPTTSSPHQPEGTVCNAQEQLIAELIAKRQFSEALECLQHEIQQAPDAELAFRHRLRLTSLLLDQRWQLAAGLVAALLEDVASFKLENWQPQLALEALLLAYRYGQNKPENDISAQEMLLQRISRLSAAAAWNLPD